MTTKAYLSALKKLDLLPSGKATSAALGVSVRRLQQYAAGSPIPPMLALLLAMYLRHGLPPC